MTRNADVDPPATVHVIDDDDGMRRAIQGLAVAAGYQVLAYASALEFLDQARLDQPGCIVLDLVLPGMDGMELQRTLRARGAMLPIIFVTGFGDIPQTVAAMQWGAFDVLEKPVQPQALLERLRRALELDLAAHRHRQQAADLQRRIESLSPRERQVVDLIVLGRHTKQIAGELELSPKTVEHHRANVLRKMEVDNVADLVRNVVTWQLQQGRASELAAPPASSLTTVS
jgi:two-component system, LuxR family, response regulator FixJ